MLTKEKIPALRIAITSECNMRCVYCPPFGENLYTVGKSLEANKLKEIIRMAYDLGIRSFRFTGGEPLLRFSELIDIFNVFKNMRDVEKKFTTNGILLRKNLNIIKRLKLSQLKVSLDTLDSDKFRKITGRDFLSEVLDGIKSAKKLKIPITINMVISKNNNRDIFEMSNFCISNSLDLKLLDLNYFDMPGKNFWDKSYFSLDGVVDSLKKKYEKYEIISTCGGYGIPMFEFYVGRNKITVKNSKMGSTYSESCKKCKYFINGLCQEGLYNLVLTADGKLRICKHREDLAIDISELDKLGIKKAFEKIFKYYEKSFHSVLIV